MADQQNPITNAPITPSSDVIAFIAELIKRFFAPTPKFFSVLRTISVIVAIVSGIPQLLEAFGVVLGPPFDVIANKAVAIAAVVAALIAQLTVKDKPAGIATGNLPFTAKKVAEGKDTTV